MEPTPTPTTSADPRFTLRLSGTPRGARLARHLAAQQLAAWGVPYGSDASDAVCLVTAELAANAVTHGLVPGRDFRLSLLRLPGRVRVEVTDARPERLPPTVPQAGAGRGLLLVAACADRWGHEVRDVCAKTVWAEVPCP
ncbi:ATP-binding protein [Streptomyces fragilis]|uniref:ATP-binding protein n=1 Tax=Streptomyces fragilis TaxID=67301 RepID=A0ABV2YC27_9ACTN|nr:ATP-binding protein [Streptomyces fragilis]